MKHLNFGSLSALSCALLIVLAFSVHSATPSAFGCGTPNNPGGNCKDATPPAQQSFLLQLEVILESLLGL
jgi:hypothetical protein